MAAGSHAERRLPQGRLLRSSDHRLCEAQASLEDVGLEGLLLPDRH